MLTSSTLYSRTLTREGSILTVLVGLSAAYVVLGGGLGVFYPNPWGKMDFNLFYRVGSLAWDGIDPYTGGQYGIFAYPPAWIAVCALLSSLPWWTAVLLWKSLNLFFLAGSVWFSLRLFGLGLTDCRAKLVFCFACFLWPTLTTLKEGQTSLFVLFFLLCSVYLLRERKNIAAGATLCLSLMKPQLAAPLLMLIAWRRQFHTVVWALAVYLSLSYVGLWLSNSSISSYFEAIAIYAGEGTTNDASNPYNVGVQNLSAVLLNLSSAHARQLGAVAGLIFLIFLYVKDRRNTGFSNTTDLIPLVLLSGPIFFGARSYDLVLVIPFFAWLLSHRPDSTIARAAAICSLALFMPLQAAMIFSHAFLSSFIPSVFFELVFAPFRSWVLLILLVSGLTLYLKCQFRQRSAEGARIGSDIDEVGPLASRTS